MDLSKAVIVVAARINSRDSDGGRVALLSRSVGTTPRSKLTMGILPLSDRSRIGEGPIYGSSSGRRPTKRPNECGDPTDNSPTEENIEGANSPGVMVRRECFRFGKSTFSGSPRPFKECLVHDLERHQ